MDINIREQVINNFKGDNYETLKRAIEESIANYDENVLPSLGVFFEIIWENSNKEFKNEIIEIIRKRVQKGLEDNL